MSRPPSGASRGSRTDHAVRETPTSRADRAARGARRPVDPQRGSDAKRGRPSSLTSLEKLQWRRTSRLGERTDAREAVGDKDKSVVSGRTPGWAGTRECPLLSREL